MKTPGYRLLKHLTHFAFCISYSAFCISPLSAARPYTPSHPDPVLEPWRWTAFPELEGLGLRCMAEDKDGGMWFGTEETLRRYDGLDWVVYSTEEGLPGSTVTALCTTRDGEVYAGTESGISRLVDRRWHQVLPVREGFPWLVYSLLESADGSLWAGTGWGALCVREDGTRLYTTEDMGEALEVLGIDVEVSVVPREGTVARVWPTGVGAAILFPEFWTRQDYTLPVWHLAPGGPAEVAGLEVGDRILSVDSWLPSGARLSGDSGTSAVLTVRREGLAEPLEIAVPRASVEGFFRDFQVYRIHEGLDGEMWHGLAQGEIVRHTPGSRSAISKDEGEPSDGKTWRVYTESDGLDTGAWPQIAQTPDGVIWTVSMTRKAVNRFDGRSWEAADFANNNHSMLVSRDGVLWVGGYGGLLHTLRDSTWTTYRASDAPLPSTRIMDLLGSSDGAIWLAALGQEAIRLDYGQSRWESLSGLWFQTDMPDGSQWFASQDSSAVRFDGQRWQRFGAQEGLKLFLRPGHSVLASTRGGQLWAAGTAPDTVAATARFDGDRWRVEMHPELSWGIYDRSVFESSDGALWFSAELNWFPDRGYQGGLLRLAPSERTDKRTAGWTHFTPPYAPFLAYGIGQTGDGTLWFGGTYGLLRFDGQSWMSVLEPKELSLPSVDVVHTGRDGDLWVGTRFYGVYHYDGETWTRYDTQDGLSENSIRGILDPGDGTVWVSTKRGFSRFDGVTWTNDVLPAAMAQTRFYESLLQDRDGALWVNRSTGEGNQLRISTTRYVPDTTPPATEITMFAAKVSQPGNTTLAWKATDPWHTTSGEQLQYAYRLDEAKWSAYSHETSHVFERIPSGEHTFEVKARDRDFNEDPTPASVTFTVTPHIYEEPWFIGLMVVLLGAIGFQTGRVARSHRRFRESNDALSDANRDLHAANAELNRERAVERVRAEVTGMASVDDLKAIVEEMLKELKAAGVDFNLCVVNIIDEQAGTRTQYGATEAGWAGEGTMPLSEVAEDFVAIYRGGQTVLRQVDDHLADRVADTWGRSGVAGQPVRPTALVDVPFDYGTLSLSTRRPDGFRDEDVALLEEMARVVALGYARFLDFQGREAQRRQLAKEAALERIRAEVASMEQADDIGRVMGMVFKEIRELGVETDGAVIMFVEEEKRRIREYCMMPQEAYAIGVDGTPATANIAEGVDLYTGDRSFSGDGDWVVQNWRSRKSRYTRGGQPRSEAEARRLQENNRALFGFTVPLEVFARRHSQLTVPFSHGVLLFHNFADPESLIENDLVVAEDFAHMISLGYARFLDFQRLETQNRALEEANEEIQEANRLKSQFLANMSHELRTPMNSIIGFTRLVLRRGAEALSERHRKNLEVVKLSADHLLYLINEILDLSKIEAGRPEVAARRFDVKALVQSCCETVGPTMGKPGVDLHDDVPNDIGEAHTDDSRLRQIVINLLSNAMKFTDEGEVRISAAREGDQLAVAVSDTGPGIPKDKVDTIFEAFQQIDGSTTRRHGGTGLGLSITKSLAELLGGTVELESRVGEGSTFTLRIPVTFGVPVAQPAASAAGESATQGQEHERTVVVIDDDPNVAFLLREELAEEGYRVVSAGSADEGMAMVKRLRPVAVTVDIIMPGKDGWETIRMLKGDPETRDVPIVVVSVSDNKELGYQLGVYDYLTKPADSDAILSVLKRLEADGTHDVLVVDDDPNAVNMISQMLEAEGIVARSATNGQEALDEIARTRPDAVFLDLLMPVMDGFAVIERLQQDAELRTIPVIVVTAKDLTAEEKAYLQEHASQVVEKGKLEPDALVKGLRQMLNDYASGNR